MIPTRKLLLASLPAMLAGLLACGGGGGGTSAPAKATSLVYTDPSSGDYRLVRNSASAGTHLVLDLVGPATGTAMGVSITLSAEAGKVAWVDVPAGGTTSQLVKNGTQFTLGSGTPIMKAKASGGLLQATVAQKSPTAPASLNGTLLQVALDLKAGLAPGAISLSADAAKCKALADTSSDPAPVTIQVGTLKAE